MILPYFLIEFAVRNDIEGAGWNEDGGGWGGSVGIFAFKELVQPCLIEFIVEFSGEFADIGDNFKFKLFIFAFFEIAQHL